MTVYLNISSIIDTVDNFRNILLGRGSDGLMPELPGRQFHTKNNRKENSKIKLIKILRQSKRDKSRLEGSLFFFFYDISTSLVDLMVIRNLQYVRINRIHILYKKTVYKSGLIDILL